jgi:uncharacterized membrane protein/protein-disulfide isomerase
MGPVIMRKKRPIHPFPFPVYYFTVALLVLAGIADSLYLAVSHYRVYTDIDYSSFCALSQAINCDTVSQSSYAVQFGLPVSVLGILAYLCFGILLVFAWLNSARPQRMWSLLFILSLFFSLYGVYLALVSTYQIHSYCLMCVVDYLINFALLYMTWLTGKRFRKTGLIQGVRDDIRYLKERWTVTLPLAVCFLGLVAVLVFFYPHYWTIKPLQYSDSVNAGMTEEGHPWIGGENPQLTIVEFSDYQCFQCNKIHYYLRQLVNQYPDKLRLVHRHFPMDHRVNPLVNEPYHVRAGPYALWSIFAAQKGAFWKANDYLFTVARTREGASVKKLASVTGLNENDLKAALKNRAIRRLLAEDIRDGIRLGLTGTPAFVIDDQTYQATLPIEALLERLQ